MQKEIKILEAQKRNIEKKIECKLMKECTNHPIFNKNLFYDELFNFTAVGEQIDVETTNCVMLTNELRLDPSIFS